MGLWSSFQPSSRGPRPVLLDCQWLRSCTEQTQGLYLTVLAESAVNLALWSVFRGKRWMCVCVWGWRVCVWRCVWRCKQIVAQHSPQEESVITHIMHLRATDDRKVFVILRSQCVTSSVRSARLRLFVYVFQTSVFMRNCLHGAVCPDLWIDLVLHGLERRTEVLNLCGSCVGVLLIYALFRKTRASKAK